VHHRLWLLVVVGAAGRAHADPIVDRDYAIDFYDGVSIGDSAQVGMGGAGAARVVGSAGTLLNASAPAVRPTTDNGWFSWDYHLDARTGKYSSDYDNNGISFDDGSGASLITGGIALRFGNWAGAVTTTAQTAPIDGSASPALESSALRFKLALAYHWRRFDLAIGAGIQTATFQIAPVNASGEGDGDAMFAITGAGGLFGMTWLPRMENYRVGVAFEGQIHGAEIETSECDPNDCRGYILHVVVTGESPNGYGLEAFGMQQLQRSGSALVVSLRGGAEIEALPGRLRVRAGSYWEPGRFDDVGGRVHGTFGFDLRVFEFDLFGRRRGRITVTADVAARYRNLALAIGFWH
jgi:hypothetical protein